MFSLSHAIRIYISLSLTILIAFFSALTAIDVILEPLWIFAEPGTEEIFRNIYIAVIVIALVAAVYGVIVLIFIYNRGLNKYQEFLRRMNNLSYNTQMRPDSLRFPEQDEFGNLGADLNRFIEKIAAFDKLKTELAMAEKEKFHITADNARFPVLIFNTEASSPYVSYYNKAFKETFLKKSAFIDSSGKTQIRYYNILDVSLQHLTIKDLDNTPFFDEKQCEWIKNHTLIPERHTLRNMSFKDLNNEKTITFDEVLFVPLIPESSNAQIMYVFLNQHSEEKPSPPPVKI